MHLISCWAMTQTLVSLALKLLCLFQHCTGLPWWFSNKESTRNAGDSGYLGLIPGLGRSPGEESGNPLQYSCLENPMDGRAWWSKGSQSHTRLSDFTFTFRARKSVPRVFYCLGRQRTESNTDSENRICCLHIEHRNHGDKSLPFQHCT